MIRQEPHRSHSENNRAGGAGDPPRNLAPGGLDRRPSRKARAELFVIFVSPRRIQQGCHNRVEPAHLRLGQLLRGWVAMLVGMHQSDKPPMRFADLLLVRIGSYSEFLVVVHFNSSV